MKFICKAGICGVTAALLLGMSFPLEPRKEEINTAALPSLRRQFQNESIVLPVVSEPVEDEVSSVSGQNQSSESKAEAEQETYQESSLPPSAPSVESSLSQEDMKRTSLDSLLDDWYMQDGKRYYRLSNGENAVGWFTNKNGERCYAWAPDGEIYPGFVASNGYTYYVNEHGLKQTGYFIANDGKRYYAHGFGGVEVVQGWFTADSGERCYAWAGGEIRGGFVASNGYTYYVNDNGAKQTGYFTAGDGKRYYAHGFGGVEVEQGWFTADSGERCYAWAGGEIRGGFVASNGYTYYVNQNGAKQTGYFIANDGKRYYAHGFGGVELAQGWFTADSGERCYAWENGEIRAGRVNSNGYTYYVNENGAKQTGYFTAGDGKRYYAHGFGGVEVAQGWFTADNGERCYAWENGEIRAGRVSSNGYVYYVNENGAKQTGYFTANDGKRYYAYGFGGLETKQGWFTADSGERCYAWAGGEIRAGFINSNGYTYYVNGNGAKQTGYFTANDGKRYYAHSFGGVEVNRGWFTADNGQRCYAWEGGAIGAGFVATGGYTYYVNDYGVKQVGYFIANNSKRYYAHSFGGIEVNQGWFTRDDGVQCYAGANGEIRVGLQVLGGMACYVNSDGVPFKGHFQGSAGEWYFANTKGEIFKGWNTSGNAQFYTGENWNLYTGTKNIGGIAYNFDGTGVLREEKTLTVTRNGVVVTDTVQNILSRVVMAEVGGFQIAEVYKAQAIAAHSYLLYQYSQGVTAPSVPDANPIPLVTQSVSEVANLVITYNGQRAFTPYYASSNGMTNYSEDIWKTNFPYLRPVASNYDVNASGYLSEKRFSLAQMRSILDNTYGAGNYSVPEDPGAWFRMEYNEAGYVKSKLWIGNRNPSVEYFYQRMIGLRSPAFTVFYDYGTQTFIFTCRGYGHGVGMSQWGAYFFAKNDGWNYERILGHYYPGTSLQHRV